MEGDENSLTLELTEEDMNAIVGALARVAHDLKVRDVMKHWRKLSDYYHGLPIPERGDITFTLTYKGPQ